MEINQQLKTITLTFDEVQTLTLEEIKEAIASVPKVNNYCIEYINGNEQHSSSWAKFYVKGIEKLVIKEDHDSNRNDKHHSYQCYYGEISEANNELFTVFLQEGDKRGTTTFEFYICQLDIYSYNKLSGVMGFIEGNFKVLVQGIGKTKAPRLMQWWIENEEKTIDYALKCAVSINKRGAKQPQ